MMYYRLKQYIVAVPGFSLILHSVCFSKALQGGERERGFGYSLDPGFDSILQPEALATEAPPQSDVHRNCHK